MGTPVSGGESRETAVDVAPGQYLDSLPEGGGASGETGSSRWYRIAVGDGERALVSGTMIPQRSTQSSTDFDGLTVRIERADDEFCSVFANSVASSQNSGDVPPSVVADSGVLGPDNAQASCLDGAGELLVSVSRTGGSADTAATAYPLELGVVVQPALDESTFPEPASAPVQHDFLAAPAGGSGGQGGAANAGTPMPGGTSFSTAPELTEPTVHAPILAGEVQYYRIPVAYGEQVRLRADVTLPEPEEGSFERAMPQMWLLNPNRAEVESMRPGEDGAADFDGEFVAGENGRVYSTASVDTVLAMNSAYPVNPRNGAEGGLGADGPGSAGVAGFYYVAVGMSVDSPELEGVEGAFTLSWDTVGEPIDAEGAAGAAGAGETGDDGAGAGDGDDSAIGFAISPLMIVIGIGVLLVLALAAVAIVLVLRRRKRSERGSDPRATDVPPSGPAPDSTSGPLSDPSSGPPTGPPS